MDVERKKNFINKDTSVSKANIKDILQNSNYIENYINYSLQDDENNLNVASKRKGSSEHKVGSGEINTQLKKLIEHLYSLKFTLEKEKKRQKRKKKNMFNDKSRDEEKKKEKEKCVNNQINNIQVKNEQGQIHEKKKKIFNSCKLVRKYLERESLAASSVPHLMKTIEIYKNKNVEEKKCQNYIITKYENVLRNMKRKHINEISEIKNNVLQDVDFLIQKYRNVSLELLQISKKKEVEKREEKKRITEICISACKRFEEDVKKKAKASLQSHLSEITKSISGIKKEKENLEKKLVELNQKMDEQKHKTEKKAFDVFENKIKEERALNAELRKRLSLEREQQKILITDLYSKIDIQIKKYEESIIIIFQNFLLNNNITMGIGELSKYIKEAMCLQYRHDHLSNDVINEVINSNRSNF
ncbi:conserved Plasmodium protein, unknown function [Plasmodium malariae]|uniref:Uncharacterized protein n=2 Tax=Plasmodium malariae TaxID=5858 RepID=A0A1D3SMZ6_PLAMA|nr:conserved Plasmodium protein, unknown function [Plasmodium malariae]SCO93227.1 conserved Plasmodium protein, unknown function [Plasmodium malariae]